MLATGPSPVPAPCGEELEQLVLRTWDSHLAEVAAAVPVTGTPSEDEDVAWSATVCVDGAWRGLVALELHGPTAELATRELLAMDEGEEVTDEDVADAVGELVNILGGSVKSSVSAGGSLSLPVVAAGRVALPRASRRLCGVTVHWHGRPVRVQLHTTPGCGSAPGPTQEEA